MPSVRRATGEGGRQTSCDNSVSWFWSPTDAIVVPSCSRGLVRRRKCSLCMAHWSRAFLLRMCSTVHHGAAVHADNLPRHEARRAGTQEPYDLGNLIRRAEALERVACGFVFDIGVAERFDH